MPGMLKFIFLGYDTTGLSLTIDIPDLLLKLVITILAPSILGKVREGGGAKWCVFMISGGRTGLYECC